MSIKNWGVGGGGGGGGGGYLTKTIKHDKIYLPMVGWSIQCQFPWKIAKKWKKNIIWFYNRKLENNGM